MYSRVLYWPVFKALGIGKKLRENYELENNAIAGFEFKQYRGCNNKTPENYNG